MELTRRRFLGAAAALGLAPVPRILLRAAEQAVKSQDDRVLVVLQLSGGNDGLNTVIPVEDDNYYRSRPTLAISKGEALRLKSGSSGTVLAPYAGVDVGLHPSLKALHELYEEGSVAVVQGVGYPNPSRSHFRSMDIWHTARPDVEDVTTGWLGNVVTRHRDKIAALDVGDERLPLALAGDVQVPSLQNLDWIEHLATDRGRELRQRLRSLNSASRGGEAERIRQLATSTLRDLDGIIEVRGKKCPVDYPQTQVGSSLKWVGQLIGSGFASRIYYLSQGGFDTHARQRDAHGALLGMLSEALGAFQTHLKAIGAADRVVLLVFSEFGRRVRENGSQGTDHGVAAPVFVVSGLVQGGVYGPHPSLEDLDDGDLKSSVDFRQVYAELLTDVLGVPSEPILAGKFDRIGLLGKVRRI